MKVLIERLHHKLENAKSDSDFSYFFSLLVAGELITKIITLISASALSLDKDRHQHRILHGLVRANGIGDWSKAIDDLLVGTASQYLIAEFRPHQTELTKKITDDGWQNLAVRKLIESAEIFGIRSEIPTSGKVNLNSWFRIFVELRNKTRGHGSTQIDDASRAAPHLGESLKLLIDNLSLLTIPSAYLKRNLSGKYRVSEIGSNTGNFEEFKTKTNISIEDGVYIFLGKYLKIPLLISDPELTDFYIANGGFSNEKYELISYFTDDKKSGDSKEFLGPIGPLPKSESEGLGELSCCGNTFTNVPGLSYDYIQREELEGQLESLLTDDRRPLITLLGRGGIGKTSLALKVIPRLYDHTRFSAVIWFSSRDIDLHLSGSKLVAANVLSAKDISEYYCKLVLSTSERESKAFDAIQFFQRQLTDSNIGPCLFVFDNFETTTNPVEIYKWIDTYIRTPNKVLITTRLREFVGDYPIPVHGMTEPESEKLIRLTACQLRVHERLTSDLIENIFKVSGGHPYIIRILVGELSKTNMKGTLPKIIAGSDEVLTALFERTYAALNPCAQRVFLTLAAWNSAISRLALESILMHSIEDPLEVEKSIDTLIQYSLAEEYKSDIDEQYFISLPFTAMLFGEKKLRVSPIKSNISSDVKLLQRFGAARLEKKELSLTPHIRIFLSSLTNHRRDYDSYKELLERIGLSHTRSLPLISRWLEESGDPILLEESKRYLYLYLEREHQDENKVEAWGKISSLCRKLKQSIDEVHALIELSQFSEVDFTELSNVTNKVNHMLTTQQLVLDNHDVKSEILSKLYNAVSKRKNEGDATDLSRIAWLALNLDKPTDAKALIEQGLRLDSENTHCQKLKARLENV